MKYKYDPARVRTGFRRKYCAELDLPSGKPSGVEMFPITADEVNRLMGDCDYSAPLDGERTTISEWMLWAALRLKYGINYLHPLPKSMQWQTCESHYAGDPKPTIDEKLEMLELKMQNYIDFEMQYFNEKFLDKINDGKKSTVKTMTCMEKDFKKYFSCALDISEI